MKTQKIFITGISTEVGKTIVSSIIVEALQADYWKPIQAGDLNNSDSFRVKNYISNNKTIIHPSSYDLQTPVSPHESATIDNVHIKLNEIIPPKTTNPYLVVEGAGGILVPLNETNTIADLIEPEDIIIVVSRHYLGSINHSLLTLSYLQDKGFQPFLMYSGDMNRSTENIIEKMSGVFVLGRVKQERFFNKQVIKNYAKNLQKSTIFSG